MNYVEYDESNLQSFEITQKAISNGSLIGTCELSTAEIEMINNSNEYSEFKNKWIKSPFGSLYVYNVEPKQEKVSIKMSCYDIKALMDAEYKQSDFEILFPCTIVSWRNAIASSLGLQFNDGNVFPNSNFTLTKHPYIEAGSSCRDVMKIIAQACASWVESDSSDKLYFKWINDNEIVIPDWLELTTEKTSTEPVNMVVLGRGDVEDIEIYPNPKPDNPVEFRIDNNYILDPQDTTTTEDRRKDVIQPIYNQVNGFTYIPFTMRTQSVENTFDVKLGTKVKYIDIWENELTSVVMSRTLKWLGNDINNQNNYELSISAEDIKETSSDYQKARPADKITQLEVSVDKQNELIKINATNIEENKKDLADITVTTKEIKASVESLDKNFQTEITTRKTATGNPTYISDSGGYALEKDFIYGMSIQETTNGYQLVDFNSDSNFPLVDDTITITKTGAWGSVQFDILDIFKNNPGKTMYFSCESYDFSKANNGTVQLIYKIGTETKYSQFLMPNGTNYPLTIPSNASECTYAKVGLYCNNSDIADTEYSVSFTKPMLSFTPNAPYEKYTGGIASPNPDYPSEIINNRGIENLIDITKGTTKTLNGITYSVDEDFVITLNGTCNANNTTFGFDNNLKDNLLSGVYTVSYEYLSGSISGVTGDTNIQIQRTTDWTGMFLNLGNYSKSTNKSLDGNYRQWVIRCDNGVVFDNYKIKVQLEKGIINHSKVPSGTNYLIKKICQKNILDTKKYPIVKGIAYANGEQVYWSDYCGILQYLPVKENTTYSFSSDVNKEIAYGLVFYDKDLNKLSYIVKATTFTTPQNCKYIRFAMYAKALPTWCQIEVGNKVTKYEEYQETLVKCDLQGNELCKIGDIEDSNDLVSGILIKKFDKMILDGSQNVGYTVVQGDYFLAQFTLPKSPKYNFLIKSDKFKYTGNNWNTNIESIGYGGTNHNYIQILIKSTRLEEVSKDGLKTWLSNNPVEVYYELAEPQIIQLEPTEIKLYEGINNIYTESNVDVEEVDITYLTKSTLNQDFLSKAEFSIKENEINQQVSQKIGENEIIASINTAIKDGQGVLELTGNSVIISADNMSVDKYGNLVCQNAVIRGGELILNDDGTHENAAIKIKTNKKIIKDIAITSDLNDSYLTQTFGDKFNFAEAASQIIFTTDENYQVKLLRTTVGSSNHVVGYTHQVVVSNNNDYNEIIYEVFHNQDEGIFTTNIDIQKLKLPSEFGVVKTINSSTYLPYIKKLLINAGLTTYSSEGMEADIYSNYKYTREDYIKVQKYLLGQVTLTAEEILFYDTNGDGQVTLPDMIVIGNNGGQYNVSDSQPGKFILDTTGINENLYVLDKDGNKVVSMGVTGTKVLTLNHPVFPDSHNQIEVGDALTYKKSELESVCGTWDDGKLIYRRVIHVENISATAIPNWSARLDLDIDIDTMVKIEGSYQVTGNAWTPINMPLSSSQAISTHYNADTKQLHIMSTFDISRGHIILEYTKN